MANREFEQGMLFPDRAGRTWKRPSLVDDPNYMAKTQWNADEVALLGRQRQALLGHPRLTDPQQPNTFRTPNDPDATVQ